MSAYLPSINTKVWHSVVLVVFCLTAVALRVWHFDWGLPLLLHPDEWSQVDVAWRIAGGDLNPHFFRYSTGYMYMLAPVLKVADWLAGPLSQPDRYALSRVMTAVLGALTVWLVWHWAGQLLSNGWALVGSLLMALLPTHVIHSHYATVDVPLTFVICLCGYALTRLALASPEYWRRWALGSGAVIGLAIGIKYTAVVVIIPLIGLMLLTGQVRQQRVSRSIRHLLIAGGCILCASALIYYINLPQITSFATRLTTDGHLEVEYLGFLYQVFWVTLIVGGVLLLLATRQFEHWTNKLLDPTLWQSLMIVVIVFACSSPFVFLDYRHSLVDIFYEYRHAKIGAEAHFAEGANMALRATITENGSFYLGQLWGDLGPALLLAVTGIAVLMKSNVRAAVAVGVLPVLVLMVALNSGNTADRYLLPAYPALCVAAAAGLHAICRRMPHPHVWEASSLAILTIIIASRLYGQLILFGLPDTRNLAYNWIAMHIPAGSRVANENYTQTPNLSNLPVTQLLSNRNYEPSVSWDGRADYLLLGAPDVTMSSAIEALRGRYGPPVMFVPADSRNTQGPPLFVFRLATQQVYVP